MKHHHPSYNRPLEHFPCLHRRRTCCIAIMCTPGTNMRGCGRKEEPCESVRRMAGQCQDRNRRASFSAMIVLVSCLFADTCLALRCLPSVRTMTTSRLALSSNRVKIRQGASHMPGRLRAVPSMQGVVLRREGCSTSCLQVKWSQNITVEDSTRSDENREKNASGVDVTDENASFSPCDFVDRASWQMKIKISVNCSTFTM